MRLFSQAIVEYQKAGKTSESLAYQQSLHRNLMYLAGLADSLPPTNPQDPNAEKLCQVLPDFGLWRASGCLSSPCGVCSDRKEECTKASEAKDLLGSCLVAAS